MNKRNIFLAIAILSGLMAFAHLGCSHDKSDSHNNQSAYNPYSENAYVCGVHTIVVDYDPAIVEEVQVEGGGSKWKPVGDGFEYKGEQEVQLELICFHDYLTDEQALNKLDELGYRPANYPEMFFFSDDKYLINYRGSPITALGTIWQGPDDEYAVPVAKYNSLFFMEFRKRGDCWPSNWLFLAVRE
ncbi:hypothetical protein ACFLZS_01790 [Patescibacteria group bacterium]